MLHNAKSRANILEVVYCQQLLSETTGFPVEITFMRDVCDDSIKAQLRNGCHQTLLTVSAVDVAWCDQRTTIKTFDELMAASCRDLQGQYHHENDYQFAVQLMAAEAIN